MLDLARPSQKSRAHFQSSPSNTIAPSFSKNRLSHIATLVMPSQTQGIEPGDGILALTPARTAKPRVSLTQASVATTALSPKTRTQKSSGGGWNHETSLSSPPAQDKGGFGPTCGTLEHQHLGRLIDAQGTRLIKSGSSRIFDPEKRSATLVTSSLSSIGVLAETKETYEPTRRSDKNSSGVPSTFANSMDAVNRLHGSGLTGW